jgi:c-di-GMP-binding flagellar brake protein YcgR
MQERRERRRSKRIKKTLYVQCRPFDTTAAWTSLVVQDISEGGINILAAKEFAIGEDLELKITTFLRFKPINVLGKVVSCQRPQSKRIKWTIRISFTKIYEEEKQIFHEYIQAL